jgi:hypothetical protein
MEEAGATVLLFEFSPLPGSELYREFPDELEFRADDYSFFVVTGHETVQPDGYDVAPDHDEIYRLIREYPKIFCGFYSYAGKAKLLSRRRMEQYRSTRRTPVRTAYDL